MRADGEAGGGNEKIEAEIDGAKDPKAKYASLPRDDDNNWIADGWEQSFGGPLVRHEDAEQGTTQNSPKGDGFSAHDEYRGFHYVERSANNKTIVRWARTDPRGVQDVYFYDPSSKFHAALRLILARQSQKFDYREVNKEQADPVGNLVERLNRNSLQNREGFPLVFVNKGLPPGVLGQAHPPNNGKTPIEIDLQEVDDVAAAIKWSKEILLAQAIAHEVGHKFGRLHHFRIGCCNEKGLPSAPSTATAVTESEVALVSGVKRDKLYVRYATYLDGGDNNKQRVADGLDMSPYCGNRKDPVCPISPPTELFRDPAGSVHLFRVGLTGRLPLNASNIAVTVQKLLIMDWTPRTTLRTATDWTFGPEALAGLCVHPRCRQ